MIEDIKKKKDKLYLKIRIIIILIAILGIAIHLIFPALIIDKITLILFFIATIPWLNILFESIEIPGLLKVK